MKGEKCDFCGYEFRKEFDETPYTSTGFLELCESCDDNHGSWIRQGVAAKNEMKRLKKEAERNSHAEQVALRYKTELEDVLEKWARICKVADKFTLSHLHETGSEWKEFCDDMQALVVTHKIIA